ncbi:predicted protein [Histoplasma capsulatum var. duboisii H88]|uniref:Predicted protein n=1 Tax=Ajellomyces capsulatus (strain H88) TaxID=544711 RepID=F0U5U4_AJEC8|nr:predicted protein [Histoplasma capsulatum var. duboisii H88]
MSAEPAERLRRRKVLFDIEAKNPKISILPMVLDEKSDLKPTFFAACPSVPELDEFDLGPYPSAKAALQFDPSGDFVRPLDRAYALEDYLVHYTCRCENRKWFEGTPTPWSGGHDLGVIGRAVVNARLHVGLNRIESIDSEALPKTNSSVERSVLALQILLDIQKGPQRVTARRRPDGCERCAIHILLVGDEGRRHGAD